MDNVTIDLGAAASAERLRGEPAILIGFQGNERITAEDLARRLDTINYEITCLLTPRVPRVYHRDGVALEQATTGPRAAEPQAGAWIPARDG
jgi:alanine racemase